MLSEEEVQAFEEENGIAYIDLFAEEDKDPIEGTNTPMDGQTVETYAQRKGLAQAAADGIYGGIRSMVELGAIPAYKITSKITTGDWGDFEQEAEPEFNKFLPPEAPAETTGEAFVQGVSKFATTTYLGGRAGKAVGLTGKGGVITNATINAFSKSKDGIKVGRILAPALNGMIGDATAFWQDKENLSNIISKNSNNKYIKGIADYLAIKEDDDAADRMLKQSLEGLFVSGAASAMFKTLKGVKNSAKTAIANQRLAQKSKKLGEELSALTESAEVDAKGVAKKEAINEAKENARNLGVSVPRDPEKISIEEARKNVAKRIVDLGLENAEVLSKEQLNALAKEANNQVEKILPSLENENKVFLGSLVKMKEASKAFIDGIITKGERDKALFDSLMETANAFGETQDLLYESGKALGIASKEESHKTIKEVLTAISDNSDELIKDKIVDIFSSVNTVEELHAKLKKLGYLGKDTSTKNWLKDKTINLTALEQAGLMTSPSTVARNIFTSAEMAVENLATKVVGGTYTSGERLVRRMFNLGEPVSRIEFKESLSALGAYFDSFKDMGEWWIDRLLKFDFRNAPQSFVGQFRSSASRQAMTNLPKEIGQTFTGKGFLSNLAKRYVQFSGVNASEKIDNFFEATFFRGEARSRALEYAERIGRRDGLNPKEVNELYNKTLDGIMGVDLTRKKELTELVDDIMSDHLVEYSIAKKAREKAAEMTFRGNRGAVTDFVSDIMETAWYARPLIPFFKTGSTIFFDRFLGDLTPLGLMKFVSPEFRAMMKKGGREAQEYYTKMTIGGGIMALGGMLAAEGRITGDFSSDPAVREAQKAAGFQPNSLVFTNDEGVKTYVSLDNLGPLSMALKYPAKFMSAHADYVNKLELPDEDYEYESMIGALTISFAQDALDESALRYFANGFKAFNQSSDSDTFWKKFGEAVGNVPLNFIPRAISEVRTTYVNSEAIKQGADSYLDRFHKKMGSNTFDMYDVFGRKMQDKNPMLSLIGAKTTTIESEPWIEKLAGLGIGFSMPRTSITVPGSGIQVEIDARDANGIRAEMGNLDTAKYMKQLVESSSFDKMSKELQKDRVNNLFGSLRQTAIMLYYSKTPELQEKFKNEIRRSVKKKTYVPTLE